ncbi:hypothetical protein JCM10207_007056 [Rhodosporidiobolus poonsookiae]
MSSSRPSLSLTAGADWPLWSTKELVSLVVLKQAAKEGFQVSQNATSKSIVWSCDEPDCPWSLTIALRRVPDALLAAKTSITPVAHSHILHPGWQKHRDWTKTAQKRIELDKVIVLKAAETELIRLQRSSEFAATYPQTPGGSADEDEWPADGASFVTWQTSIMRNIKDALSEAEARGFESRARTSKLLVDDYPKSSSFDEEPIPDSTSGTPSPSATAENAQALPSTDKRTPPARRGKKLDEYIFQPAVPRPQQPFASVKHVKKRIDEDTPSEDSNNDTSSETSAAEASSDEDSARLEKPRSKSKKRRLSTPAPPPAAATAPAPAPAPAPPLADLRSFLGSLIPSGAFDLADFDEMFCKEDIKKVADLEYVVKEAIESLEVPLARHEGKPARKAALIRELKKRFGVEQ